MAWLILYIGTIFAANWAIGNIGTCVPDGPCLIPVGFGLMAPSGVLFIGLSLAARDAVQERKGRWWSVGGILVGAGLSAILSPALALASGTAFLLSELADFGVYTPLRARGWTPIAVGASGIVGGLLDSAIFLWLAFGSLDFLAGQWLGKTEVAVVAALLVILWRQRALLNRRLRPA